MTTRLRGRPRAYDPEEALEAAMGVFWEHGFAGATLDMLGEATGMSRPSLYGAFGDKHAIFEKSVERFGARMRVKLNKALAQEHLVQALTSFYLGALKLYLDNGPRGCLVFGVAAVDAAGDPHVRELVAKTVSDLDAALRARVELAIQQGELSKKSDARQLARLASAVLHSLSVRARSGETPRSLRRFARESAALILAAAQSSAVC